MVETRLNTSSPDLLLALHNATHALVEHENTLTKTFPVALKKQFDESLKNSTDTVVRKADVAFNKLAIMQDHELSAQMALSQLRNKVTGVTEIECALLNSYTSAAQKLDRVRPEKNPFLPENYIRALSQTFEATDVDFQTRQLWFEHMGTPFSNELVSLYKTLLRQLSAQGVEPITYAKPRPKEDAAPASVVLEASYLVVPPAVVPPSAPASPSIPVPSPTIYTPTVFAGFSVLDSLNVNELSFPTLPSDEPQEQTLSFPPLIFDTAPNGTTAPIDLVPPFYAPESVNAANANASGQGADLVTTHTQAPPPLAQQSNAAASAPAPSSDTQQVPPSEASTATTTDPIQELLEQFVLKHALPDALGQVVHSFQFTLVHLAQRDDSFLTNEKHPARLLISAVIEQGLRCRDLNAFQFDKFFDLTKESVRYLVALPVHDAMAYEHVHVMWERSWEKEPTETLIKRAGAGDTEALNILVRENSATFAALSASQHAPEHWRDFLTGPWAHVVAHMQSTGDRRRASKYHTIAPVILWCVGPTISIADANRLLPWTKGIRTHIRNGLSSIGYSSGEIGLMLQRADQVQYALEAIASNEISSAAKNTNSVAPVHFDSFIKTLAPGQWFDMWIKQQCIRTQLTWINETKTSFMFVSADSRSQSLTRRMLEGLLGKGGLRRMDNPNTERGSA